MLGGPTSTKSSGTIANNTDTDTDAIAVVAVVDVNDIGIRTTKTKTSSIVSSGSDISDPTIVNTLTSIIA